MQNRLIVVSNRLPLTLRKTEAGWATDRSSGGLATAMNPLLRKHGGDWIGWSGSSVESDDQERRSILDNWKETEHCFAVDLPAEIATRFYEGFANQTLWPVFHNFLSQLKFDADDWKAYVEANRFFCKAVLDRYQPGDLIWVHDYHLMLLPQMLRAELPDAAIGFFLHIPFPSGEIFPILPRREELLHGLLGADLLGFQTHGHLQQFRSALLRVLGVESKINEVAIGGHTVHLEALPIGIAPDEYTSLLANDEATARYYADWVKRYKGRKVLLAVDRLDYTKGVPERMRAFARLLKTSPELKDKVVLIQIAVPSRERIETYQDLRTEVNQLVGEINGKLGTPDWTPVIYINRAIEREELVALYKLADICWVGPLRDGLNLVAKEYVACKSAGDGVLLLSEFAGAAAEMGEALMINPFDEERTAATVARALALDEQERQQRMRNLHGRVLRNNVFSWGDRFLTSLQDAGSARGRYGDTQPRWLRPADIEESYKKAHRRLLILDYDGTLVPFANQPEQAAPSPALLRLLTALAADSNNCVALISGRQAANLEQWFGAIDSLWLVAEHGAELKPPRSKLWEPVRTRPPTEWKSTVMPILEHFVDRTPGSFVEEKNYSVVLHYRMADPEFGEWLANEMVSMLEAMLAETELRAFRGEKTVEIRPVWVNNGEALERLLTAQPEPDFLFAAGDDRTDEDLFERIK
ncbi:MAG TPA: bifunctional alpha,alpha-trehalose-phosphate synthase (UDP-forming)/trehalose-phosphatase, partial [Candidatus Acidoferrales bacterium]|nr:bifunctional alpha,alpha-trehalose-phosphate synthase (UDP-forming)/trehalose-phosphatase [Candidatus Acidoferrales bacterium]